MAVIRTERRERGGVVIALAALVGAAISIYKYFSEASGIAGTPGALLVIITSIALVLLGLTLARRLTNAAARRVIAGASLVLIIGTVFAAYLLESHALTVLMLVCLMGWLMHGLHRRPAINTINTALALLCVFSVASLTAADTLAQPTTWAHFNGDLQAQKYSPLTQITPDNVANLRVAWRARTGDKSDGVGKTPATVWSATPLFVNDTVYLGTPFYRIFALEPDTGKTKWVYESNARLEALTQPALKNRGVAYWQAEQIVGGCTMPEAGLHRHDGCEAALGRRRYRQGLRGLWQERNRRHQSVEYGQRQMAVVDPAATDGIQGFSVRRMGR